MVTHLEPDILFFKLINFNWKLVTLQSCGFCHTLTWISHRCTYVPHPEHSRTSLPIPSLRVIPVHRPWAPSHAANLDWRSVSHMIIYTFQCYSLKSSDPCLLPPSPKVCSLHLCLFWCLTYRVIITIFLNAIYIYTLIYCIGVFLSDLTLYNRLQFHTSH